MSISVAEYKQLLKKKNKFNAVKKVIDGITFESLAEAEMYQLIKPDYDHVDCHVPVSLPGGLRLNIDFIGWKGTTGEAIEVKGKLCDSFVRMRKLFDAFHPLAPLKVYRKNGNGWDCI